MFRAKGICLLLLLAIGLSGCGKKGKPNRSVARIPPPEGHRSGQAEPSAVQRMQTPARPYSHLNPNDWTPMGYLAVVVRSRDRGRLTQSMGNLRSVGQAVEMYRATEERYPPSLEALIKNGQISDAVARSAGDPAYRIVYLPPASASPPPTDVLAFDPVCYPEEDYAVLRVDGSVGTMNLAELKAQLERQGTK